MNTIAMDAYPFIVSGADAVAHMVTQQDRAFRPSAGEDATRDERFCGPPWSGKRRWKEPPGASLRTPIRRAIITIIAHLSAAEIALRRTNP